jgi:hypothetical protein
MKNTVLTFLVLTILFSCKSVYIKNKELAVKVVNEKVPIEVTNKVLDVKVTNDPLPVKLTDNFVQVISNKEMFNIPLPVTGGTGSYILKDINSKYDMVIEFYQITARDNINFPKPQATLLLTIFDGTYPATKVRLPYPIVASTSIFIGKKQSCKIQVDGAGIDLDLFVSGYYLKNNVQ